MHQDVCRELITIHKPTSDHDSDTGPSDCSRPDGGQSDAQQSSGVPASAREYAQLALCEYEAIRLRELLESELQVVNRSLSDHELLNGVYRKLVGKDHVFMERYRQSKTA